MEKCTLCDKDSELQNSHIIPKFIIKWLKDTSATGLLRKSINPQRPIQDGTKKKSLCKECEQKFSKFEKSFAENIFYPYQKNKNIEFIINQEIILFAISLSWRIANDSLSGFKNFQKNMFPHLKNAVDHWKEILNKEAIDSNYEHHMFFFDLVNEQLDNFQMFNMYMLRGIDATMGASPNEVFCFTKLPGIFIISLIYPNQNKENVNTKLSVDNKIFGPQTYVHTGFNDFLKHRIQEAFKHKLSDKQQQKLTERILKNKERTLSSESFRVNFQNR